MSALKASSSDMFYRVEQYKERPRAIEALNSAVNYSQHFLKTMQNFTGEDQPFTEVEHKKLTDLVADTQVQILQIYV